MTTENLFRANLCANLANLSHLQLPLCNSCLAFHLDGDLCFPKGYVERINGFWGAK